LHFFGGRLDSGFVVHFFSGEFFGGECKFSGGRSPPAKAPAKKKQWFNTRSVL